MITVQAYFVKDLTPAERQAWREKNAKDPEKISKDNADLLITGFVGEKREIFAKRGIVLKGRGIKALEWNKSYYMVTEKAYQELKKNYIVVTDF